MDALDPRTVVDEPVRRELWRVVARGLGLVGVTAGLAVLPILFDLEVGTRDRLVLAAVLILVAYVVLVHLARRRHGHASEVALAEAWERAKQVDLDDAMLGGIVAGWVPAGLLLALGVLMWPHLTDENPALAVAWTVLGLPPLVFAWLLASSTWLDACREDLARAEGEADARFRRYWANVGGR